MLLQIVSVVFNVFALVTGQESSHDIFHTTSKEIPLLIENKVTPLIEFLFLKKIKEK